MRWLFLALALALLGSFAFVEALSAPTGPGAIPLSLWKNADYPNGLDFGRTNGISLGDFDADGWVDVYAMESGNLWRNEQGQTWSFAGNLRDLLPPTDGFYYGSSFGDYDRDGYPDLAVEPRGFPGVCFALLKNLGGGQFVDVAPHVIAGVPCTVNTETACWFDADFDRDLDLLLPAYSARSSFFENLGPRPGPGRYRLRERADEVGLENSGGPNPEGAMVGDVDLDGDLDVYVNAVLYQNGSSFGDAAFVALSKKESGIGKQLGIDEGAVLADYDRDGDLDVVVSYQITGKGLRIWRNRGDGTFALAGPDTIESKGQGTGLGLSLADWDNDGDLDMTSRSVVRCNQHVETGDAEFLIASLPIPPFAKGDATPAWGDWDRDGDLDAAWGNYGENGWMLENTLYDASTPEADKDYLRVRPRDAGIESEFGALVEGRVAGDPLDLRRVALIASSAGYLNQSEYTAHLGVPAGERVDVTVHFPTDPARGRWRVDRFVNPALGGVVPAALVDRELVVERSGALWVNDLVLGLSPREQPLTRATGGGLALPAGGAPLPDPVDAPAADWWVGVDLETDTASGPLRLVEVSVDGALDELAGPGNLALWDVTAPATPQLVAAWFAQGHPRNRRCHHVVDALLDPDRRYRLVARVTRLRASPFAGPMPDGEWTTHGGLSFRDTQPDLGTAVAAAKPDRARLYVSAHLRPAAAEWVDLGTGRLELTPGPRLSVSGPPEPGETVDVRLDGAVPHETVRLLVGDALAAQVDGNGVPVIPRAARTLQGRADGAGRFDVSLPWPADWDAPVVILQALTGEASSRRGSNAVARVRR